MSHPQFSQLLCETKVTRAAHGVDVLLRSSGKAQSEDVAASAGPPGAFGVSGHESQPGKPKEVPRECCSSRPASTSWRTITQKESETQWTWFGTQMKDMRIQKVFRRINYFVALKDYPTFCLRQNYLRTWEVPRDPEAGSVSSLPHVGGRQCHEQVLALHLPPAANERNTDNIPCNILNVRWLFSMYINHAGVCVFIPVLTYVGALWHLFLHCLTGCECGYTTETFFHWAGTRWKHTGLCALQTF